MGEFEYGECCFLDEILFVGGLECFVVYFDCCWVEVGLDLVGVEVEQQL